MPGASVAAYPPSATSTPASRKASLAPERKYKCQFCNRAFSRSEHRSRHERSHTKERPFKCMKCRSTFVRRDLLLRHDRTVHAKDGGVPLHSDGKRRGGPKAPRSLDTPPKSSRAIDTAALEQIEASSDGIVDVETAAMLVADLHHKAHAAAARASGAGSDQYDSPMAMAMQPSLAFANGSVAPLHPQWDSASNTSGSLDAQQVSQLPPVAGRNVNGNVNGLVPALQSMINSLPPSTAGTPAPQSPFAHRVPTPADSTASLARPPSSAGFKVPTIASDEDRNKILDHIQSYDRECSVRDGFRLPSLSSLQRYLNTYFTLFHHHLPFLHPSSFEPTEVSPPLLLAVLSIGALYAFDMEPAYVLHIGSKVLVNQFLQNKENFSSRKCPLWTMQASLLNMIFASWSGDSKGLEWACSIKSLLANMVSGNRYELKLRTEAREGRPVTRAEWVEDECCKRTYYAVYIFFGLLTMTFNHTPAISFNEFEDLELPSSEALWNLRITDEATWQQEYPGAVPSITFMEAHEKLFRGETLKYSAFATRVMINALFLEVWYHKRSPEALQDVVTEFKLRLALETWEKSLDLCEPELAAVPLSAPHKGHHPLVFNARAMFRNARARLEVDLKTVQEAMRYHDYYEVAGAMSAARNRVKRSSEMVKVIQECYDCIETVVLQGIRWVARTAPTNWSIEHSLCGMDMMIILTLWLYRLEQYDDEYTTTEEETVMYDKVRALFAKEVDDMTPLSSVVARLWGHVADEVVVWGIQGLIGNSFRLHHQALRGYIDDMTAGSNAPTPSMTSQGADEDSVY